MTFRDVVTITKSPRDKITAVSMSKRCIYIFVLGMTISSCSGFTRSHLMIPVIPKHRSYLAPSLTTTAPAVGQCAERNSQRTDGIKLHLSRSGEDNEDFWAKQKELAQEMADTADKSLREEQLEKFAERRLALVADTAYFTVVIFCILWGVANSLFTPISYAFGALFGLSYSYGLGKYVETLGGSAEDTGSVQGAGVGQARFAFLILLFIIVGKFRSQGLQEIPSILGFFTYQLASLNQGLKEFND